MPTRPSTASTELIALKPELTVRRVVGLTSVILAIVAAGFTGLDPRAFIELATCVANECAPPLIGLGLLVFGSAGMGALAALGRASDRPAASKHRTPDADA